MERAGNSPPRGGRIFQWHGVIALSLSVIWGVHSLSDHKLYVLGRGVKAFAKYKSGETILLVFYGFVLRWDFSWLLSPVVFG